MDYEDETLWFHTRTGAMHLLKPNEPIDRDEFIRYWFLVPESFDERTYTDHIRAVLLQLNRKFSAKTAFTIFTTTACNARSIRDAYI
jgi:hypothetical protein